MPVIVKARRDDSTDAVIRKFKKLALIENIVGKARDREFFKKPALIRKEKHKELLKLRRRENKARRIGTL